MNSDAGEVTRLLVKVTQGEQGAIDELMTLVYEELRRLAAAQMRSERADHTLQPTALVHEAYFHLVGGPSQGWQNRAHFFAIAARVMRRLLVDHARGRGAQKRGGTNGRVELDEARLVSEDKFSEVLALNEALERLSEMDERKARIVEMRYFVGMTAEEIAEVTGLTSKTVQRDWAVARAWLAREMK